MDPVATLYFHHPCDSECIYFVVYVVYMYCTGMVMCACALIQYIWVWMCSLPRPVYLPLTKRPYNVIQKAVTASVRQ